MFLITCWIWIAQGPWIVFQAEDTTDASTKSDIFLWKCPGVCDPINLTRTPGYSEYGPVWKSDGSSILFMAAPRDTHELYMAQPSSGTWADPYPLDTTRVLNSQPLTDMDQRHGGAVWYPDADTILLYRRCTTCDVYIFKYFDTGGGMGSGVAQLTADSEGYRIDVRSGDHKIACAIQPGCYYYSTEVYTMNSDGSGKTQLTSNTSNGFSDLPRWSPSGNKIVYVSTPDGGSGSKEIWVMDENGNNKIRLTNNSLAELWPVWFMDSIYFIRRGDDGESDIWIMDTLGNGQHPVSDTSDGWSITNLDVIWGNDCLSTIEETTHIPSRIRCLFYNDGLVFINEEPSAMELLLYRCDGRLAYSGILRQGETYIILNRGVYIWQVGEQSGKAVVR